MSNRHLSRIIVLQTLYEWDIRREANLPELTQLNIDNFNEPIDRDFIDRMIQGVVESVIELDAVIAKAAPEWPVEQIASIDKSVLRIAIYELSHEPETPPRVVINEAVELAKAFGGDNSSKFINGVLGTLYRDDPRYELEDSASDSDSDSGEVVDATKRTQPAKTQDDVETIEEMHE